MGYFRPTGGQLHLACTATPSTPAQLAVSGSWQNPTQEQAVRIFIFNASGSTEVHIAYGPTAAIVTAIAGAGGDTTAGVQDAGVISFGGTVPTASPGSVDYISLPANSFISAWCAVAAQTADVYICPGEETTH